MVMTLAREAAKTPESNRRRHLVVPPSAVLMPDAKARKTYEGLITQGDIALAFSMADPQGREQTWIVVRPTQGEQLGAFARILRVEGEGLPRPVVDERQETDLLAAEGVTLNALREHGRVTVGPETPFPSPEDFAGPGNGLIWLDHFGAIGVDIIADDPSVTVYAPEGTYSPEPQQ